jgi:glycosyltransferase involved in cell wall biosynthesis
MPLTCLAGVTVATLDWTKLTAIVRTFEQPKAVHRLLKSVRRLYPSLRTLVADDGLTPTTAKQAEIVRLPSNKGLSAAYNSLLARVRTPYFLVLDERAELHRESRLEALLELVATDRLDLAGGSVTACRKKFWFLNSRRALHVQGLFELAGDRLTLLAGSRSQGEGFWWCDFVSNFFLARTDRIRSMGGWDPELHNNPHEEFFLRAHRRGIRVGIQPTASVWLWSEAGSLAAQTTHHDSPSLAVARMGLSEMTDLSGRVIHAPRVTRAA